MVEKFKNRFQKFDKSFDRIIFDLFKADSKGEAVIYLSKKLAEKDDHRYGAIHRIINQNLRNNFNTNYRYDTNE